MLPICPAPMMAMRRGEDGIGALASEMSVSPNAVGSDSERNLWKVGGYANQAGAATETTVPGRYYRQSGEDEARPGSPYAVRMNSIHSTRRDRLLSTCSRPADRRG